MEKTRREISWYDFHSHNLVPFSLLVAFAPISIRIKKRTEEKTQVRCIYVYLCGRACVCVVESRWYSKDNKTNTAQQLTKKHTWRKNKWRRSLVTVRYVFLLHTHAYETQVIIKRERKKGIEIEKQSNRREGNFTEKKNKQTNLWDISSFSDEFHWKYSMLEKAFDVAIDTFRRMHWPFCQFEHDRFRSPA